MNRPTARGNVLINRVLFPATNHLLNRPGILPRFNEMIGLERWSPQDLKQLQTTKLVRLLQFAGQRIPYYRRLFLKIGFSPLDIRDITDLSQLPLLSREDVRENYRDLIDERLAGQIDTAASSGRRPGRPVSFSLSHKRRLVYNTTSGSTGTPTVFVEDGTRSTINWAHELRLKHWFDLPGGAREARFSRESVGLRVNSISNRLRRLLWGQMVLPGTNLTDPLLARSIERLKRFRPHTLFGITSALTSLAQFIRRQGIDISSFRPHLLITWAAPLPDHERRILSDVFDCPITNIYGTREVGHVAMRCPKGSWHANQESVAVEIEASSLVQGEHGAGDIVVTPLDIVPMPFIRYRLGDVGHLPDGHCPCGRTLRLVSQVLGRSGELYRLGSGRMLSPNFWSHIFRDDQLVHTVNRYQVVYKPKDNISIRIVPGKGFDSATRRYLRRQLDPK